MKNEFKLKPEECKAALNKMRELQAQVSAMNIVESETLILESKGSGASEVVNTWKLLKQCKLQVANNMERLTKKLEESIDQHIALDESIAKDLSNNT